METTPRVDSTVTDKINNSPLMSAELSRIKQSSGGLSLIACDVLAATPKTDSPNVEREHSRAS